MLGLVDVREDVGGMDLPFVPFTFPTVLFRRAALRFPYPSLTWGWIDRIWAVYRDGRAAEKFSGGFNDASRRYLVSQGIPDDLANMWLATADYAAEQWWGQGTWFVDFGGAPGVLGAVAGVVQGVMSAARNVSGAFLEGIARSIGVPRWVVGVVLVLVVSAVFYWLVKSNVLSRAVRAFR